MSNINITVTEQDPINVSIASPEVQNVDVTGQSISATVTDGDKGDIVVTGNGTVWTLDPNALATRVPYTGATSDVNLGEFGLLTGNLEFDTTPTNAPTGAGSMVWNDTEGTVDLVLKGGSLVLPIGQKQVIRAVNGTGGNLTRAQYRAVKITGAQGQRLQVSLARADNDANSKDTIGIVGEDISNNQTGFIVSSGLIEEINTTGSLQGETWADGDTLYLSGTTFGVITNIKPAAPIHTVILGFVVYAHSQHGKIYVKPDNGYELDELHNCNVSTAASGDYLRYNGTTWVDATISAADLPSAIDAAKIATGTVSNTEFGYLDGVTSAIQTQLNGKQATLTLTTTGTSGAATLVGATLNIPQYQAVLTNPVTGTGTTNYLPKFTGASTVGNSQIFDDGTSVGIGTITPISKFHLNGTSAVYSTQSSADNALDEKNWMWQTGLAVGAGIYRLRAVNDAFTNGLTVFGFKRTGISSVYSYFENGNVIIGGTADAGYKLDIQGSLRNTTSAYFATSSGNVGVGQTSATYKLDVIGDIRASQRIIASGNLTPASWITNSVTVGYSSAGGYGWITAGGASDYVPLALYGNVGIGTTTAAASLHVYSSSSSEVARFAYNGNAPYISFWNATDRNGYIQFDATGGMLFVNQKNTAAIFHTNNTERMRLTAAGRLLVGTTTESTYLLDVAGDIRNTTSAYFATASGNVGIGTTSPDAGLHVNKTVAGAGLATPIAIFSGGAFNSNTTYGIGFHFSDVGNAACPVGLGYLIESSAGDTKGSLSFYTRSTTTLGDVPTERMRLNSDGNLTLGITSFGTSATKTFAIGSGTAPTTSPADAFQLYSADITAGNAAPHFRTEGGAVVKIYQQTTGVGAATFVANTGTAVNDASTFDGYTLNQIVKALRNAGFLA